MGQEEKPVDQQEEVVVDKPTDKPEEKSVNNCKNKSKCKHHHCCGGSNASPIYCLSVIGALFYFLQNTNSFGEVIMGIGKAIFWPAMLMYKLLTYLQM